MLLARPLVHIQYGMRDHLLQISLKDDLLILTVNMEDMTDIILSRPITLLILLFLENPLQADGLESMAMVPKPQVLKVSIIVYHIYTSIRPHHWPLHQRALQPDLLISLGPNNIFPITIILLIEEL